jgi:hypothetical protein
VDPGGRGCGFDPRRGDSSSRITVLRSSHLLAEMSIRKIRGRKVRPARKANNLTIIYETVVQNMWEAFAFHIPRDHPGLSQGCLLPHIVGMGT